MRRCEHDGSESLCNTLCHSATGNRRHATNNVQDGTGNGQEPTCDRERASCNVTMRDGTGDGQRTRHAAGDTGTGHRKQTTGNGERAACSKERARRHDPTVGNAADDHWKMCNTQLTPCSIHRGNLRDDMQHAAGKMQLPIRSVQQTTSRQHAACSGQYAANNK